MTDPTHSTRIEPPRLPKGHRPQIFDDQGVDQLHAAYVTLATELAVAFERIDTLERLLIQRVGLTADDIQSAAADPSQAAQRMARQTELAERLLKPFKDFREHHIASGPGGIADSTKDA
ncbi:MAG: hypothetical protein ACO3IL_09980 [Steroidobacteraceae bacterium]|jgi:hypothetical protein|nr:hypothetical protein [Gammaproteobacteria bacterium]